MRAQGIARPVEHRVPFGGLPVDKRLGRIGPIAEQVRPSIADNLGQDLAGHLRTGVAVDVAKVVTWLGALPVAGGIVVLAAAWLAARRRALEAIVLVAGMGLTVAAVHVAKAAVDRPRPTGALVDTLGQSYPSGHAAYAIGLVAAAVALSRTAPALRTVGLVTIALVAAVVVGATRIYLRAHYLSDVLGGAGLAAALFALCGLVALIVDFVRHNEAR